MHRLQYSYFKPLRDLRCWALRQKMPFQQAQSCYQLLRCPPQPGSEINTIHNIQTNPGPCQAAAEQLKTREEQQIQLREGRHWVPAHGIWLLCPACFHESLQPLGAQQHPKAKQNKNKPKQTLAEPPRDTHMMLSQSSNCPKCAG